MRTKLSAIVLACALLLLAACAPQAAGAGETQNAQWLAEARLDAHETPEELYQLALAEDTIMIYSNTSRMLEVKKSFEAQYPGLVVEVMDTRTYEIVRLLKEHRTAGTSLCDLVVLEDQNALLSRELVPEGIVYKYVPWDIAEHITPEHNTEVLTFLGESELLFYNDQVYDEPPVLNWWQLTEPEFYGKVYFANPLKSTPIYALFLSFIEHSDKMADAYEQLYGVPLEIPEGSSAGHEFIRMLTQNGAVLTNSSDEVSQAVGGPGQTDPPVGIMISSKIRHRDIGYNLAPTYQLEPFSGIYAPNCVMVAEGASNISGAKLFVRWLLGETDGTGAGMEPYLDSGTWPVRSDVQGKEEIPLAQTGVLMLNKDFIYENGTSFAAFWNTLMEESGY
ncbi:substrate-binding domain-containing protein [Ruminococcaceae bacterium OttesenSCG-928-D13]|nr:substrate-binding domain-containing protein [Ruminococcaceae bacterium OttesenSCG-928-D13]